ncbi:helix-turn-helix domain-containing protein [Mycetocola miduiensis]|uniref:Helix-turn-helix domain-containing protein n=1 Tax=Mycetocola miduiensis TaxID=995034 RepID=A0A1I5AUS0_9MICO|nr:helix-turn-helix transcriptional regulator [Mycetocola miduiensis]SFN66184.1 Helix-turn-helix domain-containing protein [Mycetocola miduiensis]
MDAQTLVQISQLRRMCKSGEARAIREAAELTRDEVASVLGVDESLVEMWEKGSATPQPDVALPYGELLGSLKAAMAAS